MDDLAEKLSKLMCVMWIKVETERWYNCKVKKADYKRGNVKAEVEIAKIVSKRHQVNLSNAVKRIVNVVGECKLSKQLNQKAIVIQSTLNFERDSLLQRLGELESQAFFGKRAPTKVYLDNVRQCCMELLALNVGIVPFIISCANVGWNKRPSLSADSWRTKQKTVCYPS